MLRVRKTKLDSRPDVCALRCGYFHATVLCRFQQPADAWLRGQSCTNLVSKVAPRSWPLASGLLVCVSGPSFITLKVSKITRFGKQEDDKVFCVFSSRRYSKIRPHLINHTCTPVVYERIGNTCVCWLFAGQSLGGCFSLESLFPLSLVGLPLSRPSGLSLGIVS